MPTLADVDTGALHVPGVTFRTIVTPERARLALVCQNAHGAVELWTTDLSALPASVRAIPSVAAAGGVEVHSPIPLDPDDGAAHCDILGGPCYGGGVSLVGLPFPDLIAAADWPRLLELLAARHADAFGRACANCTIPLGADEHDVRNCAACSDAYAIPAWENQR